ncbi:MAG: hypothetical protein IPN93_07775 [Bacteroidetes bacterium]|nr:hypothetical protein [Bacteroidota bacterium]
MWRRFNCAGGGGGNGGLVVLLARVEQGTGANTGGWRRRPGGGHWRNRWKVLVNEWQLEWKQRRYHRRGNGNGGAGQLVHC